MMKEKSQEERITPSLYLVDGHNLIPKMPGLTLSEPNDEIRLIEMLQVFSRIRRKKIEVFFDGAPVGQSGARSYGVIRAHFVRAGQTADEAIRMRLDQLGAQARETLVITSDHRVQSEAKAHHAKYLDSELFARELLSSPHSPIPSKEAPSAVKKPVQPAQPPRSTKDQPHLSSEQVDEWLELFKTKRGEKR
jgi:predicted RNA-binding protein with PIN domain